MAFAALSIMGTWGLGSTSQLAAPGEENISVPQRKCGWEGTTSRNADLTASQRVVQSLAPGSHGASEAMLSAIDEERSTTARTSVKAHSDR